MESLEESAKRELRCKMIQIEGIGAIGVNPLWNWDYCPYRGKCSLQEFREKHQPKPCLYNPKTLRCPAYRYYEMPLLLTEKN